MTVTAWVAVLILLVWHVWSFTLLRGFLMLYWLLCFAISDLWCTVIGFIVSHTVSPVPKKQGRKSSINKLTGLKMVQLADNPVLEVCKPPKMCFTCSEALSSIKNVIFQDKNRVYTSSPPPWPIWMKRQLVKTAWINNENIACPQESWYLRKSTSSPFRQGSQEGPKADLKHTF